jgi:hypothetical protein
MVPFGKEEEIDFALIGYDSSSNGTRLCADIFTIAAFKMTELLEIAFRRSVATNDANTSNVSKSVTSIFGWLGSSGKSAEGKKPPSSANLLGAGNSESAEKLTKFRVYLCPIKIRYAMLLADLGLVEQASMYVAEVLRFVKEIEEKQSKSGKAVFNKKFTRALDECADRLGVGLEGECADFVCLLLLF